MADADYSILNVLILDDVRAARSLFRAILRTFNINDVLEAEDGAAALSLLEGTPRDLVITDYSMKPMDGIEFTCRLRRLLKGTDPFIQVLMVSAHSEVTLIKSALQAGVNDFIAKPITRAAVEQRLKMAVQRRIATKAVAFL